MGNVCVWDKAIQVIVLRSLLSLREGAPNEIPNRHGGLRDRCPLLLLLLLLLLALMLLLLLLL